MALDRPRFLDRRAGRAYTDDPTFKVPGEPEPVDEDFQRLISAGGRKGLAWRHRLRGPSWPPCVKCSR